MWLPAAAVVGIIEAAHALQVYPQFELKWMYLADKEV